MAAADEQQLILEAQQGSRDAFRCLVERHMKTAYNIAHGILRDHDNAEDAAQEAFVRAYESLGTFKRESSFGTWLFRIVVNSALNIAKHNTRENGRRTDLTTLAASLPDVPATGDQVDVAAHIERALHELPTMQRAAVILRHIDGLSTRQVGGILGCSESTVKTHLYRGLEKMRTSLHYMKEQRP
jgi:RNA polymerase sigma-70 factor (ECF subfamily)